MTWLPRTLPFTRLFRQVLAVYFMQGYRRVKVFPGEYVLMMNEKVGLKVRLYFNGQIWEYK